MTTYQRKGGIYRRNGKTYRRKGGTVHTRRATRASPPRRGVGVEELARSIQRGRFILKGYTTPQWEAERSLWSRLFGRRQPMAPSWDETSETDKAGFRESARRLLDAGGTPTGWERAYDEVNRRGH